MRVDIPINNVPCTLNVVVGSYQYRDCQIYVKDVNMANTAYSNRVIRFKGIKKFKLPLPIAPKTVTLVARDEKTKDETTVKILKVDKSHLETKIIAFNKNNPLVKEFVLHARDFCIRATYLGLGKYNSKQGNIKFVYVDKLYFEDENGVKRESKSPARINGNTGIIEIAKFYFKDFTIAGRFAILCHEYAHFYENNKIKDEMEADYNSAMIYLGLGFPRVDLLSTWCKVYNQADTPENRARYEKFVNYVENFDKM